MARSALIVGVGGTGQWVLVHTKKNLIEASDDGKLPDNVRLLSIDTHRNAKDAVVTGASGNGGASKEDDIRVGDVELDSQREYLGLTGNLAQLAQEIQGAMTTTGRHPASWFPAEYVLNAKISLDVVTGAGQFRPLGRLCFFRWRDEISSRIDAALNDFSRHQANFSEDNVFEVILAGSWAGGTGAGIYLDLAYLLRERIKQSVGEHSFLRGFFVLPHSTIKIQNGAESAMARAFASWREFDRFMRAGNAGAGFGAPLRYLNDQSADVRNRPFDAAYLLSPDRPSNSLVGLPPEDALFPSVAEAIVAILDDQLGAHYTKSIQTNLLPQYLKPANAGQPMYSSIGTFSYNVPRHFIREQYRLGFALDFFKTFFAIDDSKAPRVELQPNQNRVAGPGDDGRRPSHFSAFLTQPQLQYGDLAASNTGFFPWVAQTLERVEQGNQRQVLVNQATPASTHQAFHPWEGAFTNAAGDQKFSGVAQEVGKIKQKFQLRGQHLPENGRYFAYHPKERAELLPDIFEKQEQDLIGSLAKDEHQVMNLQGEFPRKLRELEGRHLEVYHARLRVLVLELLNGADNVRDVDPVAARAGRLGYAHSYLSYLVDRWAVFVGFCDDVRKERGQKGTTTLHGRRSDETQRMQRDAQRVAGPFGRKVSGYGHHGPPHQTAYEAVDRYVDFWQGYLNTRMGDLLVQEVYNLAYRCLEATRKLAEELGTAAQFFAIAPGSVYAKLGEGQRGLKRGAKDDQVLARVIQTFEPKPYDSLPPVQKDPILRQICQRVTWQVPEPSNDGSWSIRLQVRDATDPVRTQTVRQSGQVGGREAADDAAGVFRGLSGEFVEAVKPYTPVAPIVRQRVPLDDVVAAMTDKGEPLYRPSQVGQGAPQSQTHYIRVDSENQEEVVDWLGEIDRAVRVRLARAIVPGGAHTWNSTDPYRFTSIRTDEAIRNEGFDARRMLREAYLREVRQHFNEDDPHAFESALITARLLHTFPAEVNAIQYELQIAKTFGFPYNELDPRIVALLEFRPMLQRYLVARSCGLIQAVQHTSPEGDVEYAWVVDLADEELDVQGRLNSLEVHSQLRFLTRWRDYQIHQAYLEREIEDRAHQFVVAQRSARSQASIDARRVDQVVRKRFATPEPNRLVEQLRESMATGFVRDWQNQEPSSHLYLLGYLSQLLIEEYLQQHYPPASPLLR